MSVVIVIVIVVGGNRKTVHDVEDLREEFAKAGLCEHPHFLHLPVGI